MELTLRRLVRVGAAAFVALTMSATARPVHAQGTGWLMEGCVAQAATALPGDYCFQSLWTWRTTNFAPGRFLTNFMVSYPNLPTNQFGEIVTPGGLRLAIFPEFTFFTTDGRTLSTVNDGDYFAPVDFVPAAITGRYSVLGGGPLYDEYAPYRFTLVSVVPEPQTYVLLSMGLLAIGVASRRRSRRHGRETHA